PPPPGPPLFPYTTLFRSKAARATLPASVTKGFDVGIGLMAHQGVGLTSLATIRGALQDDVKKGFDMAVSLHIGVTTRTIAHGARSEEHTSELQSRGHLVC